MSTVLRWGLKAPTTPRLPMRQPSKCSSKLPVSLLRTKTTSRHRHRSDRTTAVLPRNSAFFSESAVPAAMAQSSMHSGRFFSSRIYHNTIINNMNSTVSRGIFTHAINARRSLGRHRHRRPQCQLHPSPLHRHQQTRAFSVGVGTHIKNMNQSMLSFMADWYPMLVVGVLAGYSVYLFATKDSSDVGRAEKEKSEARLDKWRQVWATDNADFHSPKPNELLVQHYDEWMGDDKSHKVLVPMCGKSIDMAYLIYRRRHEVMGIDAVRAPARAFMAEHPELIMQPYLGCSVYSNLGEYYASVYSNHVFASQPIQAGMTIVIQDLARSFAPHVESQARMMENTETKYKIRASPAAFDRCFDKGALAHIEPEHRHTYVSSVCSFLHPEQARIMLIVYEYGSSSSNNSSSSSSSNNNNNNNNNKSAKIKSGEAKHSNNGVNQSSGGAGDAVAENASVLQHPYSISRQELDELYTPWSFTVREVHRENVTEEMHEKVPRLAQRMGKGSARQNSSRIDRVVYFLDRESAYEKEFGGGKKLKQK